MPKASAGTATPQRRKDLRRRERHHCDMTVAMIETPTPAWNKTVSSL
jgi:hypothetical protein